MTEYARPKNPYLVPVIIFCVLTFVFSFVIFLPVLLQLDMMDWGYAISFVSFFMAIAFLVTAIIIFGFYRRADKIFLSKNILVQWKYEKYLWSEFTKKEYIADKKEKKFLFLTILVFIIIISTIFILINREVWKFFLIVFSALTIVTATLSFLVPALKKRSYLKTFPQAFISLNGVYLTGEFHIWDYLTARMEKAFVDEENMLVKINYSYSTSYQKAYKEIRIPIPGGRLDEAFKAVEKLKVKRKIKKIK